MFKLLSELYLFIRGGGGVARYILILDPIKARSLKILYVFCLIKKKYSDFIFLTLYTPFTLLLSNLSQKVLSYLLTKKSRIYVD